jgi:hypothetical protein
LLACLERERSRWLLLIGHSFRGSKSFSFTREPFCVLFVKRQDIFSREHEQLRNE